MRKLLSKWRVRLGHIFTLLLVFFARPEAVSLAVGCLIALAGEVFRIYSAGCIDKNQALARTGPYRWTRNPLYFGSFLLFFGLSIASGNPVIVAVFIPAFYLIYGSTIALEEKFIREKFGKDFEAFTGEVPRFFPVPRFPRGLGGGFRWSRVGLNHEYEGAAAFVVVAGILCAEFLMKFSPYNYLLELFLK
ncbi:MAG: isoprenylcysteine carboxylmethyltransferase family protein [bacterium]